MRALVVAALLMIAPSAFARPVSLSTLAGARVSAEAEGTGAAGILLLAGAPGSDTWDALRVRLAGFGYLVLSVDLPAPAPTTAGAALPWLDAARAGVAWLRSQGSTSVRVIALEAGGQIALDVARSTPVDGLVWVSPRLSGTGLSLTDGLAAWKGPALLLSSPDDAQGARAVAALLPKLGPTASEVRAGRAQVGAELLAQDAQAERALLGWLTSTSPEARRSAQPAATLDEGQLETKGSRYGESGKRP